MQRIDVMQCCDADMRTKVYSVVKGFEGKCDRMTVQDAINIETADRYDRYQDEDDLADETRRQREEREIFVGSMEEKVQHDAWKDNA